MSTDTSAATVVDAGWRFLESRAHVVVVRVDGQGLIGWANHHARAFTGLPLVGEPWRAMQLGFPGERTFDAWLRDPARPRLLNVRTAAGVPQTLEVEVEPIDEGYLLFGQVNAADQDRLRREVLTLNHELSNILRERGIRNAELSDLNAHLEAAMRDKDALVREVHHRVKNNLALITSLLRLEESRIADAAARSVLQDMAHRIQSLAHLHDLLHRSHNLTDVELGAHLALVATSLFRLLAGDTTTVRLRLDLSPAIVGTTQAIACGLLVNEWLTNALKHGFPHGEGGEVLVSLRVEDGPGGPEGGSHLRLEVGDTGVGLPADIESRRLTSFGMQLTSDLVRQLQGSLEIGAGPGAHFVVTFTSALPRPASPQG